MAISIENRQFSHSPVYLYTLYLFIYPWNLVLAQQSEETRMMGLPDGPKSFKIGLAILIQYRRVTDTQPCCHSKYYVVRVKTKNTRAHNKYNGHTIEMMS